MHHGFGVRATVTVATYIMALQGVLPETLLDLLVEREFEYARYTNGLQQAMDGGDALRTPVTQAAKHVGDACGEDRSSAILGAFAARFLERMDGQHPTKNSWRARAASGDGALELRDPLDCAAASSCCQQTAI
jgi:hypothetical protein